MFSFSPSQSLLLCCLVLLAGRFLTSRVGFLQRYSIPDPIVGGLIFALGASALATWGGVKIVLETTMGPTLLLLFFGCVGLTANLKLLGQGGTRLVSLLLVLAPFLIFQNLIGLGMAWMLDMHPLMGLVGGTVTLVGGHGTGAAYAARFADVNNIQDVMALAMTSATIGLILGGLLGGPVAEWLIKRHALKNGAAPSSNEPQLAEDGAQTQAAALPTTSTFLMSLAAALVTLTAGTYLATVVDALPISLPNFLLCLLVGIIVRNGGPLIGFHLDDRVTNIIGTIVLSLFLALTMMSMDLSSVVRLAGPLSLILLVQAAFCTLYTCFVVFRALKRDYEAAVIAGAFCGIGLGTTATAVANMQAITRRYGPAPQSFIVVPVTGAFLVDIMNVLILTALMSLPLVGGI